MQGIEILLGCLSFLFLLGGASVSVFFENLTFFDLKKYFVDLGHSYMGTLFGRLVKATYVRRLFYQLSSTKMLLLSLYYVMCMVLVVHAFPIVWVVCAMVIVPLVFDCLLQLIINVYPPTLNAIRWVVNIVFTIFSPITFVFGLSFQKYSAASNGAESMSKGSIHDLVLDPDTQLHMDPFNKNIIKAASKMGETTVKEILVPRNEVFALSLNQTLHDAAHKFIVEGYSRIPVYKDNIDHIIGVLLYKDVVEYYFKTVELKDKTPLKTPLKSLVKPVLYSPEVKKITHLLKEFRIKGIHLSIVVNEHGGTEGIVTIENILEVLVGKISDEHDAPHSEEQCYSSDSDGLVVDAKTKIIDLSHTFGIVIPPSPQYDSVGGYILYCTGEFPKKGCRIRSTYCDLTVLETNDRAIELVLVSKRDKEI